MAETIGNVSLGLRQAAICSLHHSWAPRAEILVQKCISPLEAWWEEACRACHRMQALWRASEAPRAKGETAASACESAGLLGKLAGPQAALSEARCLRAGELTSMLPVAGQTTCGALRPVWGPALGCRQEHTGRQAPRGRWLTDRSSHTLEEAPGPAADAPGSPPMAPCSCWVPTQPYLFLQAYDQPSTEAFLIAG